jgi:hypothetical protein
MGKVIHPNRKSHLCLALTKTLPKLQCFCGGTENIKIYF